MKATWEGAVIAESDRTIVIEGHHYFPRDSIKSEYFSPATRTRPVIGRASPAIATCGSVIGPTRMPHGIIRSQKRPLSGSRITLPSGAVST
jgi:hypothetical protein